MEALADAVLAVHACVIGFNVFWLFAIPIGAWRGWRLVRSPFWRLLHLACMAVVAGQAALGRECFLTAWQDALSGFGPGRAPLLVRWADAAIFWPLPVRVFAVGYGVLFAYVLAMLWVVPLDRRLQSKTYRREIK